MGFLLDVLHRLLYALFHDAAHALELELLAELALEDGGGNLAYAEAVHLHVLRVLGEEAGIFFLDIGLCDGDCKLHGGVLEALHFLRCYHGTLSLRPRKALRGQAEPYKD